jgi:hypothetical protein
MAVVPVPPFSGFDAAQRLHRLLLLHVARLKEVGAPVGISAAVSCIALDDFHPRNSDKAEVARAINSPFELRKPIQAFGGKLFDEPLAACDIGPQDGDDLSHLSAVYGFVLGEDLLGAL